MKRLNRNGLNLGGAALVAAGTALFLLYFLRFWLPWLALVLLLVGVICLLK